MKEKSEVEEKCLHQNEENIKITKELNEKKLLLTNNEREIMKMTNELHTAKESERFLKDELKILKKEKVKLQILDSLS
jgi:hypothetical protein